MKKINKGKTRKELPLAVLLILIIVFSAIFITFGICIGFLINSILNPSTNDIISNVILTLVIGTIYIGLLLILMCNKDKEKNKSIKWYINGILLSITFTLIITAITIFTLGAEEENMINYLIGALMFPIIGIISTPNIVLYVKKDTTKWKNIFYKNGNLHTIKNSKDYYMVPTPVSFEKKILSSIRKEQLKNILVVAGFMIMVITATIHRILRGHSYTGNIIANLIETKREREFGFIFFLTILFLVFAIPIFSFYISNARKKIRVVKNHKYIAYHAIITSVRNGKITIFDKNKHYTYKYCTCVGIKEKNIRNTPAILIFVPDDVLLFPDNEGM